MVCCVDPTDDNDAELHAPAREHWCDMLAAPLTLYHCAGSASAERRPHVPQQHRKQCLSTATTAGAAAASSACAPAARRCISGSAGNASATQRLQLSLSAGNASGADDLKRSTVHITTLCCDCGIVHCTCCGTANHSLHALRMVCIPYGGQD